MSTNLETIGLANELLAAHSRLISDARLEQKHRRQLQLHTLHSPNHELLRLPLIPSPPPSPCFGGSPPTSPGIIPESQSPMARIDLPPAKRARVARYRNYVPEEETIRNDYSQRYVDGGEWPQNWVMGAEPEHRFEEYPKQQRLLNLKKASVNSHSLPPSYLPFVELPRLQPSKFDVILIDPPFSSSFTWGHLQELPIPSLAADPSFVFLWVGSGAGEGLERGREILAKWGYRRCEDVVWVKTNRSSNRGPGTDPPTTSLLTRTKQHCLIGIRGTVRRSTDSWFVHCNVDTDVIIWEGDPLDPTRKPPEMYTLIENFCLGVRRLEIFGRPSSLRRGWVTVLGQGQDERLLPRVPGDAIRVDGQEGGDAHRWVRDTWENGIRELTSGGKPVVPMTSDIDALRPKSPMRANHQPPSAGSGNAPAGGNGMQPNMMMGMGPGRFGNGGRGVFSGLPQGQNQMMVQPMMGMGINNIGMGMGNGVGVDMTGWNPMMGGMGNMNVGGMNGMPGGGMGNVGMGVGTNGMGMPMMGQMGLGGGFQAQLPGFSGLPVFNNGMGHIGMPWGEQGQFGMEGGWDGDSLLNVGMNGMGGVNLGNMGVGQWGGGGGNFESYQ